METTTTFAAKVVLDSISPAGCRLISVQATYPRIIHDELLTHRRFSRNSRSSRAVPVAVLMREVKDYPYVPDHWGAAQKGMQARNEVDPLLHPQCRAAWLRGRDAALRAASEAIDLGLHKQVVNYLLMPYSWITVLISSTHWSNFVGLRVHKDAHPAMQRIAGLIRAAILASQPKLLQPGEWHLPYVLEEERGLYGTDVLKGIATARSARVSYAPFDEQDANPEKDLILYEGLKQGAGDGIGHFSPFEHPAECMAEPGWSGNFFGWKQHRKEFKTEELTGIVPDTAA
jgi:hypothetical protein